VQQVASADLPLQVSAPKWHMRWAGVAAVWGLLGWLKQPCPAELSAENVDSCPVHSTCSRLITQLPAHGWLAVSAHCCRWLSKVLLLLLLLLSPPSPLLLLPATAPG
jgi:hypothetical protein